MTLINLFPQALGIATATSQLVVVGAVIAGAAGLAALSKRGRSRHLVRAVGAAHGLSVPSAQFAAQVLCGEGVETARALLDAPDLMRQRLAAELGSCRKREQAERFALRAALLCEELGLRPTAVPGAPVLFEPLLLRASDSVGAERVRAWVVQVDESNLALVAPRDCPWSIRTELLAQREGSGGDEFEVTLLLSPMPGCREWVVSHELVGAPHNRRKARRVACRIAAWLLPCTAGTYSLRGRLQAGERLDPEALRVLPAWERRRAATIEDISPDGARLIVEHDVDSGERFYVVLSDTDGAVQGLPLAEVVSVRDGNGTRRVLGTRFCAVRLKERRALADFAHEAAFAASVGED